MSKSRPSKVAVVKQRRSIDFSQTLDRLKKQYPDAHCALNFKNPFQLLIATVLSAQCTDERVNIVTSELFKKYKKPKDLADESLDVIEQAIRSTGFYKNKAKNIKACCQILTTKYNEKVPQDIEQLVQLPGVGRKTANVVLGNAYGIASGVVVDTHVTRLSNRFGWVKTEDAVKIESALNKICQQEDWVMLSHYLIAHGRQICKARNPHCQDCFLSKDCPQRGIKLA